MLYRRRGETDNERSRVGKSGRVESNLLCTIEYNAILSLCGILRIADYFSELLVEFKEPCLSALAARAFIFDAEDPAELQSEVRCPAFATKQAELVIYASLLFLGLELTVFS